VRHAATVTPNEKKNIGRSNNQSIFLLIENKIQMNAINEIKETIRKFGSLSKAK